MLKYYHNLNQYASVFHLIFSFFCFSINFFYKNHIFMSVVCYKKAMFSALRAKYLSQITKFYVSFTKQDI